MSASSENPGRFAEAVPAMSLVSGLTMPDMHQLYIQALQKLPVGIILLQQEDAADPLSLRIIMANRVADRIAGCQARELSGCYLTEVPSLSRGPLLTVIASAANSSATLDLGEIPYAPICLAERIYACAAIGLSERFVLVVFQDAGQRMDWQTGLQREEVGPERPAALRNAGPAGGNSPAEAGRVRGGHPRQFSRFGVWEWDIASGGQFWSPQIRSILGIGPQQELNLEIYCNHVHPQDRTRFITGYVRTLNEGAGAQDYLEHRIITTGGEQRVVALHGEMITPADGKSRKFIGTVQDITESSSTERALRQSEERFEKAFRLSPIPLDIAVTHNGVYLDVNDAFLELLGYARGEVIGRSALELGIWHDPADRCKSVALLQETGSIRNFETRLVKRDGQIIDVLLSAQKLELQGEDCFLTQVRDITERKRSERALLELEERFEKAFRLSPTPIDIVTADSGALIDVNEAFLEMLGYERDQVIGRTALELGIWHDPAERGKMIAQLMASGSVRNFETRVVRRGGEARDVLLSAQKLQLQKQDCFLVQFRDITERKRSEQALRESEQRFQQAFRRSPVPRVITSLKEGSVVAVNDAFLQMAEATEGELLGRPAAELGLWQDPSLRAQIAAQLQLAGIVSGMEVQWRLQTGECLDVLLSAQLIEISGEQFILSEIQNITERKRAEKKLRDSEARFSTAFLANPIGNVITTVEEGRFIDANDEFLALIGYQREEVIGRTGFELDFWVNMEQRKWIGQQLRRGLRVRGLEIRFRTRNGDVRDGMVWYEPVEIAGEQCALALIQDITERKQAEHQLRLTAAVIEHMGEALIVTDSEGRIVSINPAFTRMTGYGEREALGQAARLLLHDATGRHDEEFFCMIHDVVNAGNVWEGELWCRRKSGEIFPAWLSLSSVRDDGGKIVGRIAVLNDITERKQYETRLEFIAYHDALTSLPNRKLLHERCGQAILRAQRTGGECAVLYMDLDKFKPVNDTYGHATGDKLLQEVAQRMKQCVRATDTVARLGGDEFVVLLDGLGTRQDAIKVAQKLVAEMAQPFNVDGFNLSISTSVGVAVWPDHGDNVDALLRSADQALYAAKQAGRNNYRLVS